jgi:hypothetical protein
VTSLAESEWTTRSNSMVEDDPVRSCIDCLAQNLFAFAQDEDKEMAAGVAASLAEQKKQRKIEQLQRQLCELQGMAYKLSYHFPLSIHDLRLLRRRL